TRGLFFCHRRSGRKGANRHRVTSGANFPGLVQGVAKGGQLYRDKENRCARRARRSRSRTKHSPERRKRHRPLTAAAGRSVSSDLAHLGAYRLRDLRRYCESYPDPESRFSTFAREPKSACPHMPRERVTSARISVTPIANTRIAADIALVLLVPYQVSSTAKMGLSYRFGQYNWGG